MPVHQKAATNRERKRKQDVAGKCLCAKPPPRSQHPVRFSGHKSYESEIGKVDYLCDLCWSRDQRVMLSEWWESFRVSLHPSYFVVSAYHASGDMMHLIYNVTSYIHLIKRICELMDGRSKIYVTIMASSITIQVVIMEIQCF